MDNAVRLAALDVARRTVLTPIVPVSRARPLPLSHAQQRLWFLQQMEGTSADYHIPMGLRLRGSLDRQALRHALNDLVERHESLRTRFQTRQGEAFQLIEPASIGLPLRYDDFGALPDAEARLAERVAHDLETPFDLEASPPIRARLVRLRHDEYALVITVLHIIS